MTMKKIWIWIFILMLIPLALFAQQDSTVVVVDPTIPPLPENPWDLILHFDQYIISFPGVAVMTMFLTSVFIGLLKIVKGFFKQGLAWVVGLVVLAVLNLINIGYVADFNVVQTLLHAFFIGVAANGFADIPWCKAMLNKVEGWFKKE